MGNEADTARTDSGMEHFGYRESLDRGIGKFGSFAAGVSYISILTGTFQLFYFGFGTAGPAYLWSWPMVLIGQLTVALCFMELAAKYPVAGSVYNWSKQLGSRIVSWSAGWLMLTASIVTLSAVVLALQLNLPRLWSGFQIVGDGSGAYDFATNAVILGTALILFTTVVNALGVRLMAMINSAGVFIELIAACLIAIILACHAKRGPEVFFSANGYGGSDGFLGAFLMASLASGYVMYGFDTASSLGEETVEPRRTAPRAILRAILASFVIGGSILVFAILSAPNLSDPQIASSSGGLQYIVEQVMWGPLGKIFLICIVIAVSVCSLAVHTAAIRMTFAMARDNALPFGEKLARVNPKTQTPITPAIVIGVIAALILVVNIGQPKIFTVLTSIAVIMIYLAYLMVTGPLLLKRLRGHWPPADLAAGGYFTMGRWGLLVNVIAVLWGAGMALNLAWPREAIYGTPWYNTWGAFAYTGVILGAGLLWYGLKGRRYIGTLASHSAGMTLSSYALMAVLALPVQAEAASAMPSTAVTREATAAPISDAPPPAGPRSTELPNRALLRRRLDRCNLHHRTDRSVAALHRLLADGHRVVGSRDLRLSSEQRPRRLPRQLDAGPGGRSGPLRRRRNGGGDRCQSDRRQIYPGSPGVHLRRRPEGLQGHSALRSAAQRLDLRNRTGQRRQPACAGHAQAGSIRPGRLQTDRIQRARHAGAGGARLSRQEAHRVPGMGAASHEHALRLEVPHRRR